LYGHARPEIREFCRAHHSPLRRPHRGRNAGSSRRSLTRREPAHATNLAGSALRRPCASAECRFHRRRCADAGTWDRREHLRIRVALGAARQEVLATVLLGGGRLALLAMALSLVGALALNY